MGGDACLPVLILGFGFRRVFTGAYSRVWLPTHRLLYTKMYAKKLTGAYIGIENDRCLFVGHQEGPQPVLISVSIHRCLSGDAGSTYAYGQGGGFGPFFMGKFFVDELLIA